MRAPTKAIRRENLRLAVSSRHAMAPDPPSVSQSRDGAHAALERDRGIGRLRP